MDFVNLVMVWTISDVILLNNKMCLTLKKTYPAHVI